MHTHTHKLPVRDDVKEVTYHRPPTKAEIRRTKRPANHTPVVRAFREKADGATPKANVNE